MTKILNVANHSVDLSDGRVLAPGEEADVKTGNRHNKSLVEQGHVLVLGEEDDEDDAPVEPETKKTTERTAPENTTNREDKKS